jgi:hypothetical protein
MAFHETARKLQLPLPIGSVLHGCHHRQLSNGSSVTNRKA